MNSLLVFTALFQPILFSYTEIDITPPEPLPLGGYTMRQDRLMEGVKDKLYARVIFLKQGNKEVLLVSCEMLTIPASLTSAIDSKLKGKGISAQLFMAATHTHSAPDSQMLNDRMRMKIPGIAIFNPDWLAWYASKISDEIVLMPPLKALKNVHLVTGIAKINRPRIEGRIPDETVSRVIFETQDDTFEIFHYSAHPTIFSESMNQTSGDYPGVLCGLKKNRMFFNGAQGDIASFPPAGSTEEERARRMANALEQTAMTRSTKINLSTLDIKRRKITLPSVKPHPEFAKRNNIPDALAQILVSSFAYTEAEVVVIQIGELAFAGIPGEPTAELGRQIQKALQESSKTENVLIVSFVNRWLGYILTSDEYQKGGYEASLSFHGADLGNSILDAMKNLFSLQFVSLN